MASTHCTVLERAAQDQSEPHHEQRQFLSCDHGTSQPSKWDFWQHHSATSSGIKVLFQLLTDYSVKHPNESQFRIESSAITGVVLPGSPGSAAPSQLALTIYEHNKKQDVERNKHPVEIRKTQMQ